MRFFQRDQILTSAQFLGAIDVYSGAKRRREPASQDIRKCLIQGVKRGEPDSPVDDQEKRDREAEFRKKWWVATKFLKQHLKTNDFPWSEEMAAATNIPHETAKKFKSFKDLDEELAAKKVLPLRSITKRLKLNGRIARKNAPKNAILPAIMLKYRECIIEPLIGSEDDNEDEQPTPPTQPATQTTACLVCKAKKGFPHIPQSKIQKLLKERVDMLVRQNELPAGCSRMVLARGTLDRIHENLELFAALIWADAGQFADVLRKKSRAKNLTISKIALHLSESRNTMTDQQKLLRDVLEWYSARDAKFDPYAGEKQVVEIGCASDISTLCLRRLKDVFVPEARVEQMAWNIVRRALVLYMQHTALVAYSKSVKENRTSLFPKSLDMPLHACTCSVNQEQFNED